MKYLGYIVLIYTIDSDIDAQGFLGNFIKIDGNALRVVRYIGFIGAFDASGEAVGGFLANSLIRPRLDSGESLNEIIHFSSRI